MADRGYNHPGAILKLPERQVRVMVRFNRVAMPLFERPEAATGFDPARARLAVAGFLRGCGGAAKTPGARAGPPAPIPCIWPVG